MSRPRDARATDAVISLLAAGTTFFTLLAWDGLAEDAGAYLVPLFWISLVVAAIGSTLRSASIARPLVPLLQTAVVALLLHHHFAVGGALGGWVPDRESLRAVVELMQAASADTVRYAAPMPAEVTAFPALMVASGAAVVLLVDLLACTLRRVPLAGLPLLAAFTAAVSLLGGVSWVTFVLSTGCFVLLLAADQATRLGHWGRALSGPVTDSEPHTVGLATVWPTASRIGFAGIGLAVLAPALLPASTGLIGGDGGVGTGVGSDEVNIDNPMIDVRRDLRQGADVPLLRVRTDDPDPRYLRLSVLDEFTGAAWLPSDRDIPLSNRADETLPTAPGLAATTERTEYSWSISVTDQLDSKWLPVPYPVTGLSDLEGDWRYDDRTLDLMTPVSGTSTAGLDYTAVGQEVRADAQALVAAPPPDRGVFVDGTRLPETTPTWLGELAENVTEGAQSDFERAVMLQQWFRVDGGFRYSIERSDEGNGTDELEEFLGTEEGSRVGYCEQFSAAMALMARAVDIPARVAVGFLRPERDGDEWVYSTHDLHAWPELYFEDAGWVRFEPTPAEEDVAPPAYTTGRVPAPQELETPSTSPSATQPTSAPRELRPDGAPSVADSEAGSLRWVGSAAAAAAVVGLLALPRGVRALLRRRRLSDDAPGGPAEGAWAEVRATALDLGLGWDDGVTLRRRARALAPTLAAASHGVDEPRTEGPTPVEALETLVARLERHRFSRTGLAESAQSDLSGLAGVVTDAMRRRAKPSAQRRAAWLPASLWRGREHGRRRRSAPTADRFGQLDRVSL